MIPLQLESYSRALAEEFEDADILAVLDRMVKMERPEYESKIPELGYMLARVRDRIRERKRIAREAAEKKEHDDYLRGVRDHIREMKRIAREGAEKKERGDYDDAVREHRQEFCMLASIHEEWAQRQASGSSARPQTSRGLQPRRQRGQPAPEGRGHEATRELIAQYVDQVELAKLRERMEALCGPKLPVPQKSTKLVTQ